MQIQQGSANSEQHQTNNTINYEQIRIISDNIKNEIDNFGLDPIQKKELWETVYDLDEILNSDEKPSKIKAALSKISNVLQSYATGLAASGTVLAIAPYIGM